MTCGRHILYRGFTLIEVIVAMAVIALGIGALLTTLTNSAGAIGHLRDRSMAEWIALNRISETRLATTAPAIGITTGEVEYAGSKWLWRQEVIDQGVAGILRLNVSAGRAGAKTAKTTSSDEEKFPTITTVYGFFGTAVGPSNGLDPTWSQTAPRNPSGSNPSGSNPAGP
jgi:general secretion pathway protein I